MLQQTVELKKTTKKKNIVKQNYGIVAKKNNENNNNNNTNLKCIKQTPGLLHFIDLQLKEDHNRTIA